MDVSQSTFVTSLLLPAPIPQIQPFLLHPFTDRHVKHERKKSQHNSINSNLIENSLDQAAKVFLILHHCTIGHLH